MKTAKLHTGEVLHFPDHTPDEAMDATAAEYISRHVRAQQQERESRQKDEEGSRFEKGLQHKDNLYERGSAERRGYHFDNADRSERQHSHKMAAQLLTHKIGGDLVTGMGELGGHLKTIAGLAETLEANSVAIIKLSKNIEVLNQIVSDSAAELIRILSAKKVLEFDQRGRPVGVKPEV